MANPKQVLRKVGKGLLYLLIGILGLVLLSLLFINTNWGKKTVKNQVVSYLENHLKTKVSIGSVDYSLPKWIELNNVYIEDQKKDTLLFGEQLKVNISMFKLLRGNTDIQKVDLKNILINLKRGENDTAFNFQFLVDAFSGNKSTTSNPDTAEMKITLDEIIFNRVYFKMDDQFGGNKMAASIQQLDATFTKFQPDRLNFGIDQFEASGVNYFMRTTKAASPDTTAEIVITDSAISTATYGLYINANRFAVKNAVVDIENVVNGMVYKNDLKELKLTQVLFNMEQSIATADSLLLHTGSIAFKTALAKKDMVTSTTQPDTTAVPWMIKARQINIDSVAAKYNDANVAAVDGFDVSHLDVTNLNANINSFLFSADTTKAYLGQLTMQDKSGLQLDTAHANFLFTNKQLLADELYIKTPNSLIQNAVSLSYDSLAGITINPQNSLLKATLLNSTIAFNDLYILLPALKESFKPAQFANKKVNFNTELRGNLQRVYLPFLQINGLDGSSLNARGTLYNLTDAKKFSYDLYIDQSRILKSDLLKFVPPENHAQLAQLPAVINLTGRFNGSTNNIVANISTASPDLSFNGSITLNNLQDPARLQYDLNINSASVGKRTIMGFIPPGKLPANIYIPDRVAATGKFKGTANGFDANMKLNTSLGNMSVKGYLKNFTDPNNAQYDLAMGTAGFNLGKFIGQDSVLGSISGNFKAKGKGFDVKTMNSKILADINALEYNNYTYRNANIQADINRGLINSTGTINDSNLVLQYDLAANTQTQYPSVVGFIDVDTARMKELNLMADTLNFSLYANLDAKNTTPGALDLMAVIDSIRLQTSQGNFVLDTVSLTGVSENGVDDINLQAPFAYMRARGAFDYDKVGQSMINYINNYYPVAPKQEDVAKEQQVVFEAAIADHPLVKAFVPGLLQYDSIIVKGNYASADTDSALNIKAGLPFIQYNDLTISKGAVGINSKEGKLNYALMVDTIQNASLQFYGTKISGAAAKDSISFSAITQDQKAKDWFRVSADMYEKEEAFNFKLNDTLLLNYEDWSVSADNFISYGPDGLLVNNFLIRSDTASISAKSQQLVANSPIDIKVDNFNLQSISSLISGDTLFASGILDANVLVSELQKSFPAFTGDASISNLVVMLQPVGDIKGSASKFGNDLITAKVALAGYGNDVLLDGNYFLTDRENQFNANLNLNRLNVKTLQGFSAGQLKNSTGNINGQVKLNGKFDTPQWNGSINFDTTQFTLTAFGAPYKINNQKIVFNYPVVEFNKFTVKDSLNHDMVINGDIRSRSMTEYDLNVGIKADDFIVMNAKRTIDNELYGFASIDANMAINGTAAAPKLQGLVRLNDKSNVTMVLPETNYQKDEGISVVKFIDVDTFDVYKPPIQFVESKVAKSAFGQYLNYNFNIEVSKFASFTIIIDPTTGDAIEVQGDALLNAGVDPGGNLVLSGNYLLESGHYNFSYQFLSRKFDLVKGSSIQFAGDPMDARINITATYTIETDSRGLLGSEITSTGTISNLLNQKIPYNVVMNLTGVLSRPTINFNITLPDGTANVNSELKTTIDSKLAQLSSDEAAMNKQVFALLLFGRFAGEQSSDFFKGNGTNFSDIARQSVSQFLSSALDNIAGDLIKGVDIDLALNSYEDFNATGSQQRTDLNLNLSKKFLNDRLTITVGKNFGLQGQDAASKANSASGSQYIPDFSADYQLSKDGRYRIRGYRKNAYEAVLDGYVIESGVSFIVTLDYEKFRELFKKKVKVKPVVAPEPATEKE